MTTINQVIVSPINTEKSVRMTGKYIFRVHKDADKQQIKSAIKRFYGVEVDKVNIIRLKAKDRIIGRGKTIRRRPSLKKAIVTLKGDKTINFNDFK